MVPLYKNVKIRKVIDKANILRILRINKCSENIMISHSKIGTRVFRGPAWWLTFQAAEQRGRKLRERK